MFRDSPATITCWAMGITQHHNSVATIKEIVNVALLRGDIGKPGAGLCPVRGHSNVQGDRTMGIWERVPDHFLDAIRDEFGFEPPREHGYDVVAAIRALRDGKARVFMGMGGNFVGATPDTEVTEAAMRNAALTVHVSTKLNRSHVVHGGEALILPALGRSEKDLTGGRVQRVTVEDSMSAVHASHGPLEPASPHLQVGGRHHLLAGHRHPARPPTVPWAELRDDYTADPPPDRTGRARLRVLRREGRPARRLRAAAPAARQPRLRDQEQARGPHRPPRSRCSTSPRAGCCCRRCARTTSSTPRSTASTTATAGSRAGAGSCSSTPTTSPPWGTSRATTSTSSASGATGSSGWPGPSGSCPTSSRAAASRPTTPRPTRWSRSTRPQRRATPRSTSRSWFASTGRVPSTGGLGRASTTQGTGSHRTDEPHHLA